MNALRSIPALFVASLMACGIVVGKNLEASTGILLAASSLLLLAGVFLAMKSDGRLHLRPLLTVTLILLILCAGATKVRIDIDGSARLPEPVLTRQATVLATVREVSYSDSTRFRILVRLTSTNGDTLRQPVSVLVTITRHRKDSTDLEFEYGERLQLVGQIYRPSAERNPGEFNARAYYEAQGILYLMRVRGYSNVVKTGSVEKAGMLNSVMSEVVIPLRAYILRLIDTSVSGEEGELLKGLLIGERGGISYATRTAFTNSGVAHVLAVSGSNVVVVYAFLAVVFGLLRLPRMPGVLLTLAGLFVYMLITGSQPPIVRATIMATVMLLGKLLGEKSSSLNSIGVAALMILAYDARQLFDVGFLLSFAAVISIVHFYPIANSMIIRLKGAKWWRQPVVAALQVLAVTVIATLGTLPLTAIYFGRVSVVGLLSNVVVLPLVGASVYLGLAASVVGGVWTFAANSFGAVNYYILWATLEITKYSGNLSWAVLETVNFSKIAAIPFYLILLTLFHLRSVEIAKRLVIALLCSLQLFWILPSEGGDSGRHTLRASFIDVGQGDAALLEFPTGESMVIDAGMRSDVYDAGERIVAPFLRRRGIESINWLVTSHPHGDHIGGTIHLFEKFEVHEVIESGFSSDDPVYASYVLARNREGCTLRLVRTGDEPLRVGDVTIYFLHPQRAPGADTSHGYGNVNNMSVVLKVMYGETSLLFTGDLESEEESGMVASYGTFLASTLLKVGHHGSKTSSSEEFLRAVSPQVAVISLGLNNRFNHPSNEVLERLASRNVEVLRTDEEGALIFESDGKQLRRIHWR